MRPSAAPISLMEMPSCAALSRSITTVACGLSMRRSLSTKANMPLFCAVCRNFWVTVLSWLKGAVVSMTNCTGKPMLRVHAAGSVGGAHVLDRDLDLYLDRLGRLGPGPLDRVRAAPEPGDLVDRAHGRGQADPLGGRGEQPVQPLPGQQAEQAAAAQEAAKREAQADAEADLLDGNRIDADVLRILEEKGHIRHEEEGTRYVYMPTVEHVGVSRKIMEDEERRRLKTLLKEVRQERGGGGFIARTAGAGRSAEDFQRDGRYLGRAWDEVRARAGRER